MSFSGFAIVALAFAYCLIQLVKNIVDPDVEFQDINTIIVDVLFISGVYLALLGVLDEYVAAIHLRLRQRDVVVERELINFLVAPGAAGRAPAGMAVTETSTADAGDGA